jgi:hypothetical protein
VKDRAVLDMEALYESPELWTEYALHGRSLRRHDVHFDSAREKRSRHFQAYEARADHNRAARRLRPLDDRFAVRERAQRVNGRKIGAGDGKANRFRTCRKQQPVVSNPAAAGERDFAPAHIDARGLRAKPQIDLVFRVELGAAQRYPVFRRGSGKVILGQIWPVDRRGIVIAQHDDLAFERLATQ